MSVACQNSEDDWLLPWQGRASVPAALRSLARRGFLVVRTGRAATGLPPALPDEIARAAASVDRQGFLVRRRLARLLAGAALAQPPESLAITTGPAGAPVFAAGGLHLSFSARGDEAVIALGRTPVGVDIEPALAPARIPWNLLRADEQAQLHALPLAAQTAAFLALWRAKEAVVKALGLGFALAPEAVHLAADMASAEGHAAQFALHDDAAHGVTLAVQI